MTLPMHALIEALQEHPGVHVRMYAAHALGDFDNTIATNALIYALTDHVDSVRRTAAQALKNAGWQPDSDHDRTLYYIALTRWDDCVRLGTGAVNRLIAALNDQQAGIRWNAARALGRIGDERAVTALILVLSNDSNMLVQRRTVEALRSIGTTRALDAVDDWYDIVF